MGDESVATSDAPIRKARTLLARKDHLISTELQLEQCNDLPFLFMVGQLSFNTVAGVPQSAARYSRPSA